MVQGKAEIAVVGAGTLGRQIALMFAVRGEEVRIFDVSAEASTAAAAAGNAAVKALAEGIPGGTPGSLVASSDLASAVDGAWLVIECIPEKVGLKVEMFGMLDGLTDPATILASNSSSLPTSRLIERVKHPERVLNLHFYRGRTVVEVMSCGHTSPAIIRRLMDELPRYGMEPFEVKKESLGFIYNRIWAAIKREALAIVAEGVSSPEEVDRICTRIEGSARGPFRRMDSVGLDVVLDIENVYAAEKPGIPQGPRDLLKSYVDRNWLGEKTNRGFYPEYTSEK